MQVEVQILKPNDIDKLNELITVFQIVFEMEHFKRPSATYLQQLLDKETFFAVIAMIERKIVAGLTVYVLDQYYSQKPVAYIYDLAVLPECQRIGVGKKLIAFLNEYCRQKGFEEVFVQVDKGDVHALNFYRSIMPTSEERVVHFYYTLKDKV